MGSELETNTSSSHAKTIPPALRGLLFAAGTSLIMLGLMAILAIVRIYTFEKSSIYQISSSKEWVFLLLWTVVATCMIAVGLSFFNAAVKRLTHNIVPGPTLYILGVTLVIIGMFLISSGGFLMGALLGTVGFYVMWLEYRSSFI